MIEIKTEWIMISTWIMKVIIAIAFILIGVNIWSNGLVDPVTLADSLWNITMSISIFGIVVIGLLFLIYIETATSTLVRIINNKGGNY